MTDKINTLSNEYANMPKGLLSIYNTPDKIYYRGAKIDESKIHIAVIGSRKPTPYGRSWAHTIATDLAKCGIYIVSGLALGIDAIAHKAAVSSQAPTLAVLASGVDQVYPRTNQHLAQAILANKGTLLSEYPKGVHPQKHHFVARNRIIAGLADAVVVIEATQRSGTHSTTNFALAQGKPVLALPGPVDSAYSAGTNRLIAQGAHLIQNARDILSVLSLDESNYQSLKRAQGLTTTEQQIYTILERNGASSLELLLSETSLPLRTLQMTLTNLEMQSILNRQNTNTYTINLSS